MLVPPGDEKDRGRRASETVSTSGTSKLSKPPPVIRSSSLRHVMEPPGVRPLRLIDTEAGNKSGSGSQPVHKLGLQGKSNSNGRVYLASNAEDDMLPAAPTPSSRAHRVKQAASTPFTNA